MRTFSTGASVGAALACSLQSTSYKYNRNKLYTHEVESINRELKQTNAAAANLQISVQKNSRPSEFSRPSTSITLNLNRNLPVYRRRVSLLKLLNLIVYSSQITLALTSDICRFPVDATDLVLTI